MISHFYVNCLEICDGDRLHGYAILFSGGWDAYVHDQLTNSHLLCIGRNFHTSEEAMRAVNEGVDFRAEEFAREQGKNAIRQGRLAQDARNRGVLG